MEAIQLACSAEIQSPRGRGAEDAGSKTYTHSKLRFARERDVMRRRSVGIVAEGTEESAGVHCGTSLIFGPGVILDLEQTSNYDHIEQAPKSIFYYPIFRNASLLETSKMILKIEINDPSILHRATLGRSASSLGAADLPQIQADRVVDRWLGAPFGTLKPMAPRKKFKGWRGNQPTAPRSGNHRSVPPSLLKRQNPNKTSKKISIPRPLGQPGRRNGYNVQEAMGLKHKNEDLCRTSRVIRSHTFRYLNPHKTIQKQDQTRVDMVIKLLMEKYPFLQRFQGGWAVRDLMKKTLQNSVSTFRKDEKAEALATEQRAQSDNTEPPRKKRKIQTLPDSDASEDSDGDSDALLDYDDDSAGTEDASDDDEEIIVRMGKKSTQKKVSKSSDAESDDEELFKKKTTTKMVEQQQKQSSKRTAPESDDEEVSKAAPKLSKKVVKKAPKQAEIESDGEEVSRTAEKINKSEKTVKNSSKYTQVQGNIEKVVRKTKTTKPNEKEREKMSNNESEGEADMKKVLSKKVQKAKIEKRKTPPTQEEHDPPSKKGSINATAKLNTILEPIPLNCPITGCKESIPTGVLSCEMADLYSECRELTSRFHYSIRELSGINYAICSRISWEHRLIRLQKLGRTRGWPLSNDLPAIFTDTLKFESQILTICTDACQLENTVTWSDFLKSINFKIHEFGGTDINRDQCFEYAGLNARCGYLGPIASDLISSTICRILSKSFADIKRQLRQTIKLALLAESGRIDSETEISPSKDILRISDFIEYVLVPEAATYLIAQDMEVSYLDAIDIKNESNEFGEVFQRNVKFPQLLSLIQAKDEVSDEHAANPVPLQKYSPIRDWSQHPPNPPSSKSGKKSKSSASHSKSPLVTSSPKSRPQASSVKPPKVVNKPDAQEYIELTVDDFPPRGSKTITKPKIKGAPRSSTFIHPSNACFLHQRLYMTFPSYLPTRPHLRPKTQPTGPKTHSNYWILLAPGSSFKNPHASWHPIRFPAHTAGNTPKVRIYAPTTITKTIPKPGLDTARGARNRRTHTDFLRPRHVHGPPLLFQPRSINIAAQRPGPPEGWLFICEVPFEFRVFLTRPFIDASGEMLAPPPNNLGPSILQSHGRPGLWVDCLEVPRAGIHASRAVPSSASTAF
ncbi:hypothetical protein C8R44DRAFT_740408 [Mycena epipterygia]|nr:hypothetical protein C8R44DRAFT_740408 [Mycena epipterygia]